MKIIRWLTFIPVFLIFIFLIPLFEQTLLWMYHNIFPMENFWDFVIGSTLLSITIVPIAAYCAVTFLVISIGPNPKICSWILGGVLIVSAIITYRNVSWAYV